MSHFKEDTSVNKERMVNKSDIQNKTCDITINEVLPHCSHHLM